MKKTLTINLGGIVFHIDEDAYLSLNHYLESLKIFFSNEEGSVDILNDIESRIAEILNGKRTETNQVITMEEVNEVIAIMGQPVEIDQEESRKKDKDAPGEEKGEKRFFRNPDEKIIAGVCSGIAAYFNLDPVWVRLIFLVFTFAGGSGILLYLVLWVVIPEAQTTTEKLTMHGHKVNISNIEKSLREEVSELRSRMGNMASGGVATLKNARKGSGSFFEMIGKGIADILTFCGKAILILTGIILMIAGLGLLLAFAAYTLGWTGGIYSDNEFTVLSFPAMARILLGCSMPVAYLQVILVMFLGIPLFMLFFNGLRMVFRFERIRHLGLTMFNIWVVALFFMAWSALKIYHLYKFSDEKQIEIAIENQSSDTLFVSLIREDPGMPYLRHEQFNLPGDSKTIITEEKELYVVPKIRVEPSEDSLFSISQVTMARGKSRLEARQHLTGIRFQSASSGATLKISPFARLPREECWRGQMADLVIRIPRGKFIHFDKEFQELRPFWLYHMTTGDESTFRMTENGIESIPVN